MPKPTNENHIKIIKKRLVKIAKKKKTDFIECRSTPASEKTYRDDFQDLIDKMCEEDPEFKKLWEEDDDA